MKHHPTLVCVTGLKNSGKTTVCTALITDLNARGYRVAALKSSHVAELALDHPAGDSHALAESGARFVLVQGSKQSLIFERGARTFAQMRDRVPEDTDFIVSEGCDAQAAAAVVICLSDAGAWKETLRVRRVPRERILAVAGPFAGPYGRSAGRSGASGSRLPAAAGSAAAMATFQGFPLIDITLARDRQALVERILQAAG